MKKTPLLLIVALIVTGAYFAQKYQNIIGVFSFRLWNGLRIKYELVSNILEPKTCSIETGFNYVTESVSRYLRKPGSFADGLVSSNIDFKL